MVGFGNFELFILHRQIKKPQSTRILVRATEIVRRYGPMISGDFIAPILGDAHLARLFTYDFHQGDPQVMLAHWQVAFAALQDGEDEVVYFGPFDQEPIDLIVDSPPQT